MGITVLGIGAILLWGAPTLQAIQDRNSVIAMEGELIDVRTATLDLMIDKSSRLPEVVVAAGQFGLEPGSNFLITSNQFQGIDPGDTRGYFGCEMIVTDWSDADTGFKIDKSLCTGLSTAPTVCTAVVAGRTCLDVALVAGGNADGNEWVIVDGTTTWDVSLVSGDFSSGDWVFRLYDDAGAVAGQSWLLRTGRLAWELASTTGTYGVYLEGSAVFEVGDGKSFLIKAPAIQEDASGNSDYFMRLPTYIGTDYTAVSAPVTAQVFVGQVGNNHVRISSENTDSIRFQVDGDLAESWCRALIARNSRLAESLYAEPTNDACLDDVSSVVYERTVAPVTFAFELSHARITTRIQL